MAAVDQSGQEYYGGGLAALGTHIYEIDSILLGNMLPRSRRSRSLSPNFHPKSSKQSRETAPSTQCHIGCAGIFCSTESVTRPNEMPQRQI
jgi:hypothetical protein